MFGFDFVAWPLAVNIALFAAGAIVVWKAGTRLAINADALAERTGIGRAFIGLVLLAGVTELPECVTSLSAVFVGNAPLAINNLFGGIVMQTAILAIADRLLGKGSLSFFSPKPELLLQGILLIVLLSLVLAGIAIGDRAILFGVGGWTTLAFALYLFAIWLVSRFEAGKHWRPVDLPGALVDEESTAKEQATARLEPSKLWIPLVQISLVILVAGTLLVGTSEALADQLGLA